MTNAKLGQEPGTLEITILLCHLLRTTVLFKVTGDEESTSREDGAGTFNDADLLTPKIPGDDCSTVDRETPEEGGSASASVCTPTDALNGITRSSSSSLSPPS